MVRAFFSVRLLAVLCAASLWLVGFAQAEAGLMQYTLTSQSTITGTLGGTAFSDKTFSMTETGDTSNIVYASLPNSPLVYQFYSLPGTVTITIDGVGTATFISTTDMRATSLGVYYNGNLLATQAGFVDFGKASPDGVGVTTSNFYDLSTPFSESSSTTRDYVKWYTSSGDLVINYGNPGSTTFTASAVPVPEPSSLALGVVGVGLALLTARRRQS